MVMEAVFVVGVAVLCALLTVRVMRVERALAATLGFLATTLARLNGQELPPELTAWVRSQDPGAHRG
jgi:hypothetical protein